MILYELLTGHSPYRLPKGSRDVEELASVICDREPTRPSVVIGSRETVNFAPDDEPAEPLRVSAQRSTTVGLLRKKLRGDLDHILALALRKEPEQRYPSVEQFSTDLQRCLDGLPISARKATFWYRTSKFVLRHRLAVAFGSLAVLLLLATTGFAIWKARQLAKRVDADHRLASSFLVDIHDSIARLPGATPAREALLDRALQYLNGLAKDAGDDPGLQKALAMAYEKAASLQGGHGRSGAGKGDGGAADVPEGAEDPRAISQCLAARPATAVRACRQLPADCVHDCPDPVLRKARRSTTRRPCRLQTICWHRIRRNEAYKGLLARSELSMAYGMTFTGDWEQGRRYLTKALEIRRKQARRRTREPQSRDELAHIYYRFGVNAVQSGQSSEALNYLRQTLAIQISLLRDAPEDAALRSEIAANHHFTGIALGRLGQLKEALKQFDEAIEIRKKDLENDPLDVRSRGMIGGQLRRTREHATRRQATGAERSRARGRRSNFRRASIRSIRAPCRCASAWRISMAV